MRLSQFHLRTEKETPAEAEIASAVEDLSASGAAPIQMASADPMLTDPNQNAMTMVEDMTVIALTGRTGGALRGALAETDVLVAVPHDRRVRVLETHLLVLDLSLDSVLVPALKRFLARAAPQALVHVFDDSQDDAPGAGTDCNRPSIVQLKQAFATLVALRFPSH